MIRVLSVSVSMADAPSGILVEKLRDRGVELVQAPVLPERVMRSRWRSYLAARRFAGLIAEFKPHMIHAHGFTSAELALEVAEQWARPYVLSADRFLLPGQSIRISRKWLRGVIAGDSELACDLIRGLGLPDRWVSVIPPGLELSEPWTPKAESRVPVVATAVGTRFGSGLATFLEASRMVLDEGLDVEFVLADLDGDSAFARRLADGLGVVSHVTITEFAELNRTFWPVIDLYCHPLRWPDPGRRLVEAMSWGLPCIASDLPVIRNLSHQGTACTLVPAGDSARLASAMIDLLKDPDRARQLGLLGYRQVERHHSVEREVELLSAIYRRSIEEKRTPEIRHRADRAETSAAILRS